VPRSISRRSKSLRRLSHNVSIAAPFAIPCTGPMRIIAIFSLLSVALSSFAAVAHAAPAGEGGVVVIPQPAPDSQPQVVYVAPTEQSRVGQLEARLLQLRLERSQYRIGGPIAMLSIGSGSLAIFGLSALVVRGLDDIDSDVDYDRPRRVLGGLMVVSGVMIIVGSIRLSRRLGQRRVYNPEIQQIRLELRELRRQGYSDVPSFDFAVVPTRGGGFASLHMTF
jgi:hypothetical protein